MTARAATEARVAAILRELPEETRPVAEALCALIRAASPELRETVKWGNPTWVGRGNAVGLMIFPRFVHLALFRGAELSGRFPEIVGTGKSLRHVVVPDLASVRRPVLRRILRAAVAIDASG